jgi:peptidyl-prolyl cis-trans isomerase D
MLELMRKHAGSWMIKILLAAIAIAFALSFGVYSYYGSPQEVALKVNGEPITTSQVREEVARMTEEARAQMGEQFDKIAPLLNFRQRAMDRLVDRALLFQAALRMGIVVTEVEIRKRVSSMQVFQRNGQFDLATYQRVLSRNRLTPEDFETLQRDGLIMEKLSVLVAGAAQITPLEVDFELEQRLTEVKGVYKLFNPDDYLKEQKVSQAEIESFYNQNKKSYLVPEKLVLAYITFPAANYRDKVDIRPVDIRDFYDINRNRYAKPERVKARHILFTLPEKPTKAQDEAARKLAEKVLELAKQPGQDFAKLAKEHSQGPTAKNGGDLGYFGRGQMVKPFEELAFKLKSGEIDMVKTRFGWHVIKVEDHQQAQITPLEKVEAEIKNELIERMAKDMAAAAAERAFDQIAKGGDLKELAKNKKQSVYTTEPVAKGKRIEGLPGLKGLVRAVEGLAAGQVIPVLQYEDGSIVAVLDKFIPESVKPLKDVEEEVRLSVQEEKAEKEAESKAAKLLDQLRAADDPGKELLKQADAKETGWLKPGEDIDGLEHSARLADALFLRPDTAKVLAKPVPAGDVFAAAALTGRKAPEKSAMDAMREEVRAEMLLRKRRQLVQDFLADLRDQAEIQMVAKR